MNIFRILIIDDEELIRKGLCARIRHFQLPGTEVYEADGAVSALEIIREMEIHLVISDICMPNMNGLELIRRIKEIQAKTRFLLLSGYSEFSYAKEAIHLGVRGYLNKPVSNSELKESIELIMKETMAEKKKEADTLAAAELQERLEMKQEQEINQIISEARSWDQCSSLPFSDRPDNRFYLCILHVGKNGSKAADLTTTELSLLRFSIKNMFEDLCPRDEGIIVNSYQSEKRMYAVMFSDKPAGLRKKTEQIYLKLSKTLQNHMNVRLTMGVSALDKRIDSQTVAEARTALHQRLVYGRSNIYFKEDIHTYKTSMVSEADMELFRRSMMRREREGTRRILEKIFLGTDKEGETTASYHALCVRVMGAVLKIFGDIMDERSINQLISQIERQDNISDYSEMTDRFMEVIDECLNKETGRDKGSAERITEALMYIREHYNENIIINELAARLDMSPNYFSSLFKKETHQTTVQYITAVRIERAMEYLKDTNHSVAVIAKNVGYDDSQYFFRVFKKVTGETPLQYRQRLLRES